MKKMITRVVATLAVGGMCFAVGAPQAEARSQGAVLGKANLASNTSCFNESFGGVTGVTQTCPTARNWTIPLIYDDQGNKTIRISAQGFQPNDIVCKGFSVNSNGGDTRIALPRLDDHTNSTTGAVEQLRTKVFAHGFGGTWAICTMAPNTRLINVHY